MRWILASTTLTLLGTWLLCPADPLLTDGCTMCPATRADFLPCGDDLSGHTIPAGIEDELVKSTLTRKASDLIDGGRTVDMPTLIRQLKQSTCTLALQTPQASVYDPVDLYSSACRSVVVVSGVYKCNRCSHWHVSTASGFVLTADGAIVTNYHVVNSPENQTLVVMTADRQVHPVKRVLAASHEDDLAILKIDAERLAPLPLVDRPAHAPVGTEVSVISHPDGRYYFYSAGVVSRHLRLRSAGRTIDALTITAEYARGSSGAPVLNRQGQVVAVVSSTESIYYTQDGGRQRDLQMVFRTCIPATSILRLIQPAAESAVAHRSNP